MQMVVMAKAQYGKTVLYPACQRSAAFAKALGTKTLTLEALQCAREMGFVVTLQADLTLQAMLRETA